MGIDAPITTMADEKKVKLDADEVHAAMHKKMGEAAGFIAALDQSGGSTPKALLAYGVKEDEYNGEEEMFGKVHEMRTRIIKSPSVTGERVVGAILFEGTMDREIDGQGSASFLWHEKNIVPFVKCDKGLADEVNDCQVMKDAPALDELLKRAKSKGVYGTKMRSNINAANEEGIKAVVKQQFEWARKIIDAGLMPIVEPEVNINSATKKDAEEILKRELLAHMSQLGDDKVMLKLTLPEVDNHYKECIDHPNCHRVVALSGGYPADEANERLSKQNGMIASFSRAFAAGLSAGQSAKEFDDTLDATIAGTYEASCT